MVTSNIIAAIGNFDGVHRGHQALIRRLIEAARPRGARTGAVVFDPHPRRYFRPHDPPFLITTPATRDALLREAGVDIVIRVAFDSALAAMTPDQFVAEVLKERLALAGAVVGRDFRFGKGRAGDAAALRDLSAAHGLFALIVEPTPADGGGKIGSTAIREAIAAGQMERAADLLGRRWRVEGRVEEGSRLGRTIGFPTANLRLGDIIEPRRGVYAVWARRRGRRLSGVANFGRRPTVGSAATLLEVHLFDQAGDFYGERIDVEFVGFIRDEVKFPDLDALKRQIAADCETARKILAASA